MFSLPTPYLSPTYAMYKSRFIDKVWFDEKLVNRFEPFSSFKNILF